MTINEVYDKVMASDELKKSFAKAAESKETFEAWIKAQGCDASAEEVAQFLKGKTGELSDDELESVAGGIDSLELTGKIVGSFVSAGVGCLVYLRKDGGEGLEPPDYETEQQW